jgi:hypothetical protein
MSDFEETIEVLLAEAFPRCLVRPQYPVKFNGDQLFIDFFIPSMNVAIECQGEQHYKFIPHFHKDKEGFAAHQARDAAKRVWASKNKVTLIEIPYNECPETPAGLFNFIYKRVKK